MGNVTFLGVEGSGKTVLTMSLFNAFKAHADEGWRLRPESRDAFRFLEQMPNALYDKVNMPGSTSVLRHLEWSVLYQDEVQRTLDVLDYPGEVYRLAFLEAKDDPDPESFAKRVTAHKDEINALLEHLVNSDSVFVLFNLSDAQDLATNAANLDAVWVTNVCLDYLHRLPQKPKVTLLLTQIDRYCSRETGVFNAKEYVAQALPLIHTNFPSLDVLGVAAVGPADATFGIKNIIRRCLAETKIVSESIAELKASKELIDQGWEQLLVENPRDVSERLLQALKAHYSTRDFSPWLFPQEALVAANALLTDGAIKECCQIAKCFSNSSTDALSLAYAYQSLSRLSICSAYGIKVLDYLRVALPVAIKKVEKTRMEHQFFKVTKIICGCVLLGLGLFFIISESFLGIPLIIIGIPVLCASSWY